MVDVNDFLTIRMNCRYRVYRVGRNGTPVEVGLANTLKGAKTIADFIYWVQTTLPSKHLLTRVKRRPHGYSRISIVIQDAVGKKVWFVHKNIPYLIPVKLLEDISEKIDWRFVKNVLRTTRNLEEVGGMLVGKNGKITIFNGDKIGVAIKVCSPSKYRRLGYKNFKDVLEGIRKKLMRHGWKASIFYTPSYVWLTVRR